MSKEKSVTMNKQHEATIRVGHYLCALIDVLGQQEALRNLDSESDFDVTHGAAQSTSFVKHLGDINTTIWNFRNILEQNVKHWRPTIIGIDSLPILERSRIEALAVPNVKLNSLSDMVIAHASIDNQEAPIPMAHIWSVLCALMFAQLRMLAEGKPVRGGVDLGLGFEPEVDELYGPALARAYHLESKVAQTPRILVGRRLVRYITGWANDKKSEGINSINMSMAENVINCLMQDIDGEYFLDFAGHSAYEWFKCETWANDAAILYDQALKYVEDQIEVYRETRNQLLAFRYAHLHDYLLARRDIWIKAY
jgi:hypothetical protein